MPEPRQLSDPTRRARPAIVFSFCQLRVGQTLSGNRINKQVETLQRVDFDVAEVQPESELINVAMKMLFARVMVNAMQPALEQCPNGFDSVCIDVSAPPLAFGMVYGRVVEEKAAYARIRAVRVCVERRADLAELMYCRLNGRQIIGLNRQGFCASLAFAHSEHSFLSNRAATLFQLLIFVLAALKSAHKGFVNLNHTAQFINVFAAGFAESLQHEPSGLLSDADFLCKLHRTDALASRHQKVHRVNPFMQRNVRPLENRARSDREGKLGAAVAAVVPLRPDNDAIPALALRTDNAVRPQAAFEIEPSGFLIWEPLEKLKRRYCASTHRPILANFSGEVKYIIPKSNRRAADPDFAKQLCKSHHLDKRGKMPREHH